MQRSLSSSSLGSTASAGSDSSRVSGQSGASSEASSQSGGAGNDKGPAKSSLHEEASDTAASLKAGVFGVLFTISKEKADQSPKWTVLKICADFIQLMVLVSNPDHGWRIDEGSVIWKMFEVVQFSNPIVKLGYDAYVIILYLVAAVLMMSLLLCVWVGWCFKNQRFPAVWPIKVLRLFVSIFFQVFYVASLGVFLVALSCSWFGGAPYMVRSFPDVQCLDMPHVVHMVVASVLSCAFILVALMMTAADFEFSPISNRWMSAMSTSIEVRNIMIRTVAMLAYQLLNNLKKVQALCIAMSMFLMAWSFIRFEPHLYQWTNHVRAGLYGSLSWSGLLLLVLVFSGRSDEDDFAKPLTTAMIAGVAPMWLLFMGISYLRYNWHMRRVLPKFQKLQAELAARASEAGVAGGGAAAAHKLAVNMREVYRWHDVQEVEMVARCVRRWDPEDDEVLDPEAVKLAELVLKGGMAFFGSDPAMVLLYSNFLIEVCNQYQAGHSQLLAAKTMHPSLSQQFAIFSREQMHTQRAATQASGESSVDLVSYVEFQRNHRAMVSTHKRALHATRSFWKLLLRPEVQFSELIRCFNSIDNFHARAEKMYKMVLERYPSSAKILKLYARFLEEIKNDPWTAAQYMAEAEKLEEAQSGAADNALLASTTEEDDANMRQGKVDERTHPVCVINATGQIQMANKRLLDLFGYKRGQLDEKNVSVLMPQPFSSRHNTYLKNFQTTGKVKILDSVREVLALHKDRYVFASRIFVTKVSGEGADAMYMGVFKHVDPDPNVVRAYLAPGGMTLCVDQRYVDWFGRHPNECVNKMFTLLVQEAQAADTLVAQAGESSEQELDAGRVKAEGIHILHRYDEPVQVDITARLGGTETQRVLVLEIRRRTAADLMMVTDSHGRIVYVTTDLAACLGYEARQMHHMDLNKIIPQPYSQLHSAWMKAPSVRIPTGSCRGRFTVTLLSAEKRSVPFICNISTREDSGHTLYVVKLERSTFETGVDQRRLSFRLHDTNAGMVSSLVSAAPSKVFGTKPDAYVGKHLSLFLDVFREARLQEGGTIASCTKMLTQLINIARETPGTSFRVGVHPPVDDAYFASHCASAAEAAEDPEHCTETAQRRRQRLALDLQMLERETRPAVLMVELKKVDEQSEESEEYVVLHMYNASSLTGVIEFTRAGAIIKPGCCPMHIPGPLFGALNRSMLGKNLRHYIEIPHDASLFEWLMSADAGHKKGKKKGALKGAATMKMIGPTKMVEGKHADGLPMLLQLECVVKTGDDVDNRLLVRVRVSKPEGGSSQFPKLLTQMLEARTGAAGGLSALAAGDWLGRAGGGNDDGEAKGSDSASSAPESGVASDSAGEDTEASNPRAEAAVEGQGDAEPVEKSEPGSLAGRAPARLSSGGGSPVTGQEGSPPSNMHQTSGRGTRARRASFQLPGDVDMDEDGNALAHSHTGPPRHMTTPTQLPGHPSHVDGKPHFAEGSFSARCKDTQEVVEAEPDVGAGRGLDRPSGSAREDASSMADTDIAAAATTAGGSASGQSEFRRGKRYKKLQVLLSSKQSQSLLVAFQRRSWLVTAIMLGTHITCFALLIVAIANMRAVLEEFDQSGHALEYMHSVSTWVRTIDALYKNKTGMAAPSTNGKVLFSHNFNGSTAANTTSGNAEVGIPFFIARLANDVDAFEVAHQGVYLGFSKLRRLEDTSSYKLRSLWEADIAAANIYVDTANSYEDSFNTTLWELGNAFIAAAREVVNNHERMATATGGDISTDRNHYFVINNGPTSLNMVYTQMLDEMTHRVVDETAQLQMLMLIMLIVECVLVVAGLLCVVWLLNKVGRFRYTLFSVFLVVPTAFLRALASKRVVVDDEEVEESDDDADDGGKQQGGAGGGAATMMVLATHNKPGMTSAPQPPAGLWGRIKSVLGVGSIHLASAPGSSNKKRLVKSALENMYLLTPFALWAALIVIVFSVTYVLLDTIALPMSMVSIVNFLGIYVARLSYFANELCTAGSLEERQALQALMKPQFNRLRAEWDVVNYGPTPEQLQMRHYALSTSLPFLGSRKQALATHKTLFTTTECQRDDDTCFVDGNYYYEATHQGVGVMLERFLEEFKVLMVENASYIDPSSMRLDYIWQVGLADLMAGLEIQDENTMALVESTLALVTTLHIILLVISILLVFVFLFFMVRPFINRAKRESKRVAELLSQVPPDLDVESLVAQALAVGGARNRQEPEDGPSVAGRTASKLIKGD